jgi:hypothetical protein
VLSRAEFPGIYLLGHSMNRGDLASLFIALKKRDLLADVALLQSDCV